jgi:hypothetical protein
MVLLAAVLFEFIYLQHQISDLKWELSQQQQHLETYVDVIEREMLQKLTQRLFEQKPSRIPPLAERVRTEERLEAEIRAKARAEAEAKAKAKVETPAPVERSQ